MADRQLKIVVRTEIKKGFGDLSKQIEGLSKQLKQISGLSSSINRLADSFDKVGSGANVARKATAGLNKETTSAIRIVNQYASLQDKAAAKATTLNNAVKAGTVSKNAALKAEISILNDLIKKTGDLKVLESRRDSKGRFGYGGFSSDAVKQVKASMAAQATAMEQGGVKLVTIAKDQAQRISNAMSRMTMAGTGGSKAAKTELQNFYNSLWAEADHGGTKLVTEINGQAMQIKTAMARLTMAGNKGSTGAHRADQQSMYNGLFGAIPPAAPQGKGYYDRGSFVQGSKPKASRGGGGFGGGGSGGGNIGGPSSANISAVNQLIGSYTKLGHVLFQLQYATYTLFGLSGIGMIVKQSDEYINLRNEIARTSDSTADLGKNMKAVFDISKDTFSDAGTVGKLFAKVNKYSTDLGLSNEQVGTVTRGISGAFAASSGTADAKAAAQYQFLQGFQSGKLGGDELRSVLEQADFVGDIIAKNLNRVRGKGDGVANLRDSKNPVTPQEMVAIFGDAKVVAEIMRTLAEKARTFGDVIAIARTRMLEYTGRVQAATGFVVQFNQSLAEFIAGDKFDKFTGALENATVAAATFALVAGLKGPAGMAIKGGKAVAGFAGDVGTYVGGVNRYAARTGGSSTALIAGDIASNFIPTILKLGKALFSVKGIFLGVAGAIALLVGRFNNLLKASNSGINMFDILTYVFRKIVGVGKVVIGVLGNIFSPILNFVDKFLLNPLVRATIGNKEIQGIAAARIAANKAEEDKLPTGQKSSIPGLVPSGDGDKKKRDPWKEFITDTNQNIAQSKAMLNMPDAYKDIADAVTDIQKRAADALDLLNFDELRQKFPAKAAEVDKLANQIRNLKLTEKINAFYDGVIDDITSLKLDLPIPGLSEGAGVRRNNQIRGIQKFLDNPDINIGKYQKDFNLGDDELVGQQSLKNRVKSLMGNGKLDEAQSLLGSYLNDDGDGMADFISDLNKVQTASETIRSTWQNGVKSAIASVKDSFNDVAGEVNGVLLNAVNGLQNSLVSWIQTGKFHWKDFVGSILTDLATLFVRQRLLKPLFDFVGGTASAQGEGWLGAAVNTLTGSGTGQAGNPGETAGVVNGTMSAVKESIVGPNGIVSMIKGAFTGLGSMIKGIFGGLGGGLGKGIGAGIGSFISAIFHNGGVAGSGAGGSRMVNPAIFNGAQRYHTGGIAGLAPNEVPAILQKGERILSLGEQQNMGRGSRAGVFAPSISISYTAAPSGGGSSSMSQEDHAKMISDMVQGVVRREIVDYEIKSRKPGSASYIANKYN